MWADRQTVLLVIATSAVIISTVQKDTIGMMMTTGMNIKLIFALCLAPLVASAQEAVQVGRGSYAAYPPPAKGLTDAHSGDKSTLMQSKTLWVNETHTMDDGVRRPIPTNDWWTDLLNERFADALWSYPQMVHPSEQGVTISYPSYWIDNGTEMKSLSSITIGGKGFEAISATADDWHDWDVEMLMSDNSGKRQMLTTLAHGIPFTWIETKGIQPTVSFSATPTFYNAQGEEIDPEEATDGMIAIAIGDDIYGLYTAEGIGLRYSNGTLRLLVGNNTFVSIALLPSVDELATYAQYAYSKPTATTVTWKYDEQSALLTSTWTIDAVNLKDADAEAPVLQGFLPHAYHNNTLDFDFTDYAYQSPRGKLKMATSSDNTFSISMFFSGILPYYAVPEENESTNNPFSRDTMTSLMENYATNGTFGDDTYWGGKGLTQMALCMTFAHEMGNDEVFKTCRDKLKAKMVDWLTYEPGESQDFFAYYPRWGGLVGFDTSYDSDTFNDHHFHYGYYVYAGALLCMFDDDFKSGYGEMLKLVAKDYANWDRGDSRFPFMRTLDPWAGHSYAGGLGDGANSNGNGQESSSESMQAWGGLYLLGVALGDEEMRNAGIFGWCNESRGTAEYWFDRGHVVDGVAQTGTSDAWNYDYSKYTSPYCTNLTSKGIGWWTWFSGDNLWMHSIQWMPVSPCLNYLSQDLEFAQWDYETMMKSTSYQWFEASGSNQALSDESVGNVVLCYMERFDPDGAAEIFDQALANGNGIARNTDTGHISYYVIHSHRTYGDIDFTRHADLPTATVYKKGDTYNYIAYNPDDKTRTVNFYDADGSTVATYSVPAHSMTVNGVGSTITSDDNPSTDDEKELKLFNVAKSKTAYASSCENQGMPASNATDDDETTRWGSEHSDDQWIYVDLGEQYDLYNVEFVWEAAYASSYEIQISDDAQTWTTAKTVTGCLGGTDRQSVSGQARYVKMKGLSRHTDYGYSLYEFRVFAIPVDATDDTVVGMDVVADNNHPKQGDTVSMNAILLTKGGDQTTVPATWTITDSKASTVYASAESEANVEFTPTGYGTYTCTAVTADGEKSSCDIEVEESLCAYSISLDPDTTSIVVGETIDITATVLNQFGGVWNTTTKQFSSDAVGTYKVDFDIDGQKASAVITVSELSGINLALDKPTSASSDNGDGVAAKYATDGNATGTRWESSWTDLQRTLTIDLEAAYRLSRMAITWENAYASKYHIDYSLDGQTWNELYTQTAKQTADKDLFDVEAVTARYVRLTADEKALTAYGVSIYEWEVYGTEKIPLMQLVSNDEGHLSYEGEWDESVFDQNDNALVSTIDLTDVESLPEVVPATYNPNALFYVSTTDMTGDNLIYKSQSERVVLADGCNFAPLSDFVAQSAQFNISLTADKYSFLCLPFHPQSIPLGVKFYSIQSTSRNSITIAEESDPQAGRVYIVQADATANYTFIADQDATIISSANNTVSSGVTMVGIFSVTTAPIGVYMFNSQNELAQVASSEIVVYPFAGYILNGLDASSDAKVSIIVDGSTSGISELDATTTQASEQLYNLSGMAVSKNYRGIVIQKGKKRLNL